MLTIEHTHDTKAHKKNYHKHTTYPCDNVETENGILDAGYLIFQFGHSGPLTISFSCHVTRVLLCSRFIFYCSSFSLFFSHRLTDPLLMFVFSFAPTFVASSVLFNAFKPNEIEKIEHIHTIFRTENDFSIFQVRHR